MRKISVPINIKVITNENLPVYLESVKKCKAHRVFLIGMDCYYPEESLVYKDPQRIAYLLGEFKKVAPEVGFWVSSLGHGSSLNFFTKPLKPDTYTPIEGVGGEICDHGFCPTDERFVKDYGNVISELAKFGPDIIMFDDDFRMHSRGYYMGCFCEKHRKEYFKRIGEEVPREKLEKLILSGGKNKYRSEYMHLMGETLVNFAKELRRRVDEVNPKIRMGCCTSQELWDTNGISVVELQNAFKGNTVPFTRVCSAPYWDVNIIGQVETTRQEFCWLRNSGLEVMSEGDTYPRPRYNCPSKTLELFDMLLMANNPEEDNLLNYIFEYNFGPEYESGYIDRYIKNEGVRNGIAEIFSGKTPVGVEIFQNIHILENYDFPEEVAENLHRKLVGYYQAKHVNMLSKNSVPTCYENQNSGYPVFVAGEHAKYLDLARIKNGAILDYKSAQILTARGVDVGLISAEPTQQHGEYFVAQNGQINGIGVIGTYALSHKDTAEILSKYTPDGTTSVYRYENQAGQRFLVIGYDAFLANLYKNYFHNYFRQEQLFDNIQWLCGKKLPAKICKNPNLYVLASRGENSLSVALANIFIDDVIDPVVELDREYSKIRFVNCSGKLVGNKVYLSDISAYGFAAFEVE